ncbi:Uncharacterized protein TCAP_01444 [Tolypocladium capitatum]|uniref:F-box domain-containing protein n=1 Tax=Tolypocladium capitatum TaxID=45235 RepID=A0A2K3QM66_9HYPO|nr:Uncharacterized protein TCAP_01444 [Tolypocladium capitatum]
MTSLLDWPTELQLSILDLLSFTDLLSMSVVDKHFRILTEPLLYSKIEITWARERTPPITLLLRSILDRPELSGHICSLRLDGEGFTKKNHEINEPPALPVTTLPISKASEIIHSTGVPQAKLWVDELQSGTVDAIVALLLSMLPNLTFLHIGPNFALESRLLGKMLRCALCESSEEYRLPAFRSLHDVTLSRRTNEYRHRNISNTADVLPFFYLLDVRCLSISIDNPTEFVWPVHAPTPSSLTSLELCRLRETRLEPLLSVLNGLQKLHWHWYYQPDLDRDVSKHVIELDTMAEALCHVGDTLTDLTIVAETCPELSAGCYEPPELEMRGSLGGLAHLGQLRRLCLPWAFLMGFSPSAGKQLGDALPENLELLILTADLMDHEEWVWDDDSIVRATKSGLENQTRSFLTNLHRILLPIPIFRGDMTEERKAELSQIGAHAGVGLEWDDDE